MTTTPPATKSARNNPRKLSQAMALQVLEERRPHEVSFTDLCDLASRGVRPLLKVQIYRLESIYNQRMHSISNECMCMLVDVNVRDMTASFILAEHLTHVTSYMTVMRIIANHRQLKLARSTFNIDPGRLIVLNYHSCRSYSYEIGMQLLSDHEQFELIRS